MTLDLLKRALEALEASEPLVQIVANLCIQRPDVHDAYASLNAHRAAIAALRAQIESMQGAGIKPIAYVPIHPRSGPLWNDTYPATLDPTQTRSTSYPVMALHAGEVKTLEPPGKSHD